MNRLNRATLTILLLSFLPLCSCHGWVPCDTQSLLIPKFHRSEIFGFVAGLTSPAQDSKVKAFVLYSLRHTMLTRLGSAGANAFDIQKVADHASALISQRYVHPPAESIKLAFNRLQVYNANASKLVTDRLQ